MKILMIGGAAGDATAAKYLIPHDAYRRSHFPYAQYHSLFVSVLLNHLFDLIDCSSNHT